jgi:hypothetical protein
MYVMNLVFSRKLIFILYYKLTFQEICFYLLPSLLFHVMSNLFILNVNNLTMEMKHGLREVINFESCGLKICFFSILDIDISCI